MPTFSQGNLKTVTKTEIIVQDPNKEEMFSSFAYHNQGRKIYNNLPKNFNDTEIIKINVNDKEKNPPSSTPIPIKLDMTFDGISGLTMGQLFRVNETRLPQAYRNKNVIFVVVAEDQTVDENGNWTTKISGQMQLFPGKPSSDAAASVLPIFANSSCAFAKSLPALSIFFCACSIVIRPPD